MHLKENATPFGVDLMRSQVLYLAAQPGCIILCHADLGCFHIDCWLARFYAEQQTQTRRTDKSCLWPVLLQQCAMAKSEYNTLGVTCQTEIVLVSLHGYLTGDFVGFCIAVGIAPDQ